MIESVEFDEWIFRYKNRPQMYQSLYNWNLNMKNENDVYDKIETLFFLYENDKEKCKEFIQSYLLKNTVYLMKKSERTELYAYFDKYKEDRDINISIIEFSDLKSLFTYKI